MEKTRGQKNRWEKVMADFLILAQLEGSNTTEMVKMTPKTTKSKIDPEKSYNQHLVPRNKCAHWDCATFGENLKVI
jgi:hypothetical protein